MLKDEVEKMIKNKKKREGGEMKKATCKKKEPFSLLFL